LPVLPGMSQCGRAFRSLSLSRRPAILLAAAALATAAFAPAGQPDPSRRPNFMTADVDFAMRELCFPWVKGEASVEALADRQGIVEDRSRPAWAAGATAWWVGRPIMTVAMGLAPGGVRTCTVRVERGDTVKLRAALDGAMAAWRVPVAAAAHNYSPGAYDRRELLCGPKDGPHDTLLISTGGERKSVAMMLTLMTEPERSRRCDTAE
jgi:hypothetical protein